MLPSQILLNNLLYDSSQLAIPTDRVDAEQLHAPSHWNIAFIRRFMLTFGPISSLFDFLTFGLMLGVLHAGPVEFRTGWFVESLATQTLIIFAIRTRRVPFFRSRPGGVLTLATFVGHRGRYRADHLAAGAQRLASPRCRGSSSARWHCSRSPTWSWSRSPRRCSTPSRCASPARRTAPAAASTAFTAAPHGSATTARCGRPGRLIRRNRWSWATPPSATVRFRFAHGVISITGDEAADIHE